MEQSCNSRPHRPAGFGGFSHPSPDPAMLSYFSLFAETSRTIDLGCELDSQGQAIVPGDRARGQQPQAGQWIGRYLLIEPLGAGSQAVVWRAAVDTPSSREVALKLLATSSTSDLQGVARLRREAERGKRLRSPAILEVSDFGIANGVAYMAMPLVEGATLADALDCRHHWMGGGHPPDEAIWLASLPRTTYLPAVVGVLVRVARALMTAHEAAVIHCDIKPANILLDRHHPERVFLADFGLGRDLDAREPGQRWDLSGTPRYMAPELLLGRPADGKLCDIYSLGVTLFEAVTGTLPFRSADGSSPLAGKLTRLAMRKPALVRDVAPWVPPRLGAIIETAMAVDPFRRHPTAAALADDLERFLSASSPTLGSIPTRRVML